MKGKFRLRQNIEMWKTVGKRWTCPLIVLYSSRVLILDRTWVAGVTIWRVFLVRGKRRGALVDLPGRALFRCQSVGMCQSGKERKLSGCAKGCLSRWFLSSGLGSEGLTCQSSLGLLRQGRFRNTTMPASPDLDPLKDRYRRFGHDVKLAGSWERGAWSQVVLVSVFCHRHKLEHQRPNIACDSVGETPRTLPQVSSVGRCDSVSAVDCQ